MKLSKLLLCGIATGVLAGCSTPSSDQDSQSTDEAITKDKEKKIEQTPTVKYLFNSSAEANFALPPDPDRPGGSDGLYGVLSNPIKETIKSIWKTLENKGFSGYDVSLLDAENVGWYASFNGIYVSLVPLAPPQKNNDFHQRFVEYLVSSDPNLSLSKSYFPFSTVMSVDLKYVTTLFGLTFNNKALTFVKTNEDKYEAVLANKFRPGVENGRSFYVPTKIDSDSPVTQEQIDEWNQVFIDALKHDPFFGKALTAPTDTSGSTSALAALKGTTGVNATQFTVNGGSGSQIDLGLPVYVQLKGSVDQGKSTGGTTGLVAYKSGNSALGVVQSYANSGAGFADNSSHMETSIIAAYAFGSFFVEGQIGSVSATDVNSKDWSGVRYNVRTGVDTPYGAPFVQLTHRNFGSSSDTAAYIGFEIATTEFKADTYAFSTTLLTRVGHHSIHGITGSVDLTAALTFNSGVAFNSNLNIGSAVESKAAFNMSLDR